MEKLFRYYIDMRQIFVDRGASLLERWAYLALVISTYRWFKYLIRIFLPKEPTSKTNGLAIVFSENQYRAADWLRKNGVDLKIVSFGDLILDSDQHFSHKLIFVASLANSDLSLSEICKYFHYKMYRDNYWRLVKLLGVDFLIKNCISIPKVCYNFNDHSPANVLYFDQAKLQGAIVIYMQHAPVSDKFPKLYHDLNILFSKDSISKYKNPNRKRIFEMFDVRFDIEFDIEKVGRKVGGEKTGLICTSLLDNLDSVLELIETLIELGHKVILREHPRENRSFNFSHTKFEISQNKSDYDDIALADYVIANESSIILQSVFMDRLTYKASFFSKELYDNYGFLKSGLLINDYDTIKSIIDDIESEKVMFNKSVIFHFIGEVHNKTAILNDLKKELELLQNETQN